MGAVRELMRTCLTDVTSLRCIGSAATTLRTLMNDTQSERYSIGYPSQNIASASPAHLLPMLDTLIVTMYVSYPDENYLKKPGIESVREWWDELLRALAHRRDIELPVRTLHIVGGWTSERIRGRTAKLDAAMRVRATGLVNHVVDERMILPEDDDLGPSISTRNPASRGVNLAQRVRAWGSHLHQLEQSSLQRERLGGA